MCIRYAQLRCIGLIVNSYSDLTIFVFPNQRCFGCLIYNNILLHQIFLKTLSNHIVSPRVDFPAGWVDK